MCHYILTSVKMDSVYDWTHLGAIAGNLPKRDAFQFIGRYQRWGSPGLCLLVPKRLFFPLVCTVILVSVAQRCVSRYSPSRHIGYCLPGRT